MGARHTKLEGSYLPNEQAAQRLPLKAINDTNLTVENSTDPRSPNGQRTPIILPSNRVVTTAQLVPADVNGQNSAPEKPLQLLKKILFKEFTYNVNDPRSPSLHLNRTPLIFEDSHDRTLDLDDTFADLFVESNNAEAAVDDVVMRQSTDTSKETSCMPQQQFDPRSPSIGVDRTPIIFSDDDNDASEDAMLENILATMTLNLDASGSSSIVSMKPSAAVEGDEPENALAKPANKHLDRVRVAKKTISKGPNRKQRRLLRQKIYEDIENQLQSTPQMKKRKADGFDSPMEKRTPLSCMRNRSHLRSRSVESSAKTVKTYLPLRSFDDTLNPGENHKVTTVQVMFKGSQSALEL